MFSLHRVSRNDIFRGWRSAVTAHTCQQCLLQALHMAQGILHKYSGECPVGKALSHFNHEDHCRQLLSGPVQPNLANCQLDLLRLTLQAEALKHTVGDKVHQAQHKAESTWEETYRKAPTGSHSQKASNNPMHCLVGQALFSCSTNPSMCLSVLPPFIHSSICSLILSGAVPGLAQPKS